MADKSAFPQIEGLLDLACRSGVDVRPTLLRVLTDLYVQARSHTPAEESQYVELAIGLIDSVDAGTRKSIAERLAAYPYAPAAVVHRLRGAAPDVSASSPIPPPLPRNDLSEAFFAADSFERRLILTNLEAVGGASTLVAPAAATETCYRLEAAVLEHNIGEFQRLLESALSIPQIIAERIAGDASGESILVAAKALGMPKPALQRILLLINPAIGHSVERIYGLAALYDEISMQAARSMVEIWRGRHAIKRHATHHTALYDDTRSSARAAAMPSRYQSAPRRNEPSTSRFKNSGR